MNERIAKILSDTQTRMDALPGHTGFYYKDLVTGESFGVREKEPFLAASVIKLPIYLYILREAAAGRADLTERLTVHEADKLPISGALNLFVGEPSVDLQTLCNLMISLSDNTATNLLIRRFGLEELNGWFRELGLEATVLRRVLFDDEAASRGVENTVSPYEMGSLLEELFFGRFVSPEVSRAAMELLKQQQVYHKLGGMICEAAPIAHKTGEDPGITNDVGIVCAAAPFVACYTGHDTWVPGFENLIRESSYQLFLEHQSV